MGYAFTFWFIVMDYITGVLKAFATGTFSSKIMRQGLFHKASLLCVMTLGFSLDYAQNYIDLGTVVPVGGAVCAYITVMELGSIIENLCQTNPDLMPDKLCNMFGVNRENEEKQDENQ